MALATPQYLQVGDLEEHIGAAEVDRLFDDDGDGLREDAKVDATMAEAEAIALSRMLRGWTEEQVIILAANDPAFTGQVAWIACELATERRPQFTAADGWGRFRAQYERAIQYLDALSKSQTHSKGERVAGKNQQTGGKLAPRMTDGTLIPPTFGPSAAFPLGKGGF